MKFKLWQRVEVFRNDNKRWCPGTVVEIMSDGAVFIAMHEKSALTPTASTRWADTLRCACRTRVDLAKRISFGGGKHGAGLFDSTLWYLGARPYLFAHVFSDVVEVRVYR